MEFQYLIYHRIVLFFNTFLRSLIYFLLYVLPGPVKCVYMFELVYECAYCLKPEQNMYN